jgi:hypothetical protein
LVEFVVGVIAIASSFFAGYIAVANSLATLNLNPAVDFGAGGNLRRGLQP